jgi:hypothetical protein
VPAEDDVMMRTLPLGASGLLAAIALAGLAGCGASQPHQAGEENNFDATPSASGSAAAEPSVKWSDKVSSRQRDDSLTDDQKAQMEVALRRGGKKAAECINVSSDAKPGEGEVKVTFDGKIGKVTEVSVGAPWAGIPLVESCIKRAFVGEYIVPFDGTLEVPYTVKLAAKGAPAAEPKKDAKDTKDQKLDIKIPSKDPKKK